MHQEVLSFWFEEIEPEQWWKKDLEFDEAIRSQFGDLLQQAIAGELCGWRQSAKGSLAEVIVLDQFSRNIYRNKPESFANDSLALALSQFAISKSFDSELSSAEKVFLYMPFMHSESPRIHQEAVKLYESVGIESNLEFELKHKVIIDRFGRYPHRNYILGRDSTAEETEFLKQAGSGF